MSASSFVSQAKTVLDDEERFVVYEMGLKAYPTSYKIWHSYLKDILTHCRGRRPDDPSIEWATSTFGRAFYTMATMPVVGTLYFEFLLSVGRVGQAGRTVEKMLLLLPEAQHKKVFALYDAIMGEVPELAADLKCRRAHSEPGEEDTAAPSDESDDVARIGSEISTDTSSQAVSWTKLADYYIRCGQFERARSVFELGLESVVNARDFAAVWNAYMQFEEKLLLNSEDQELQLRKIEALLEMQPLLLNDVQLRQNANDVHLWQARAQLYIARNDLDMAVRTFADAIRVVDGFRADGKKHVLWVTFARFYEDRGDIASGRAIFEKALAAQSDAEEFAAVLAEYCEMEVRQGFPLKAIGIVERAMASSRVRSPAVYGLYADLHETIGSSAGAVAAYEKAIGEKICTPQQLLNFAALLEEEGYFEQAFAVYERGVAMFRFPNAFGLWVSYLTAFVNRYGSAKIERIRDLFEQVCNVCPAEYAKIFFIMYADAEERHGLARRAMLIYERAVQRTEGEDKFAMIRLFAAKSLEYFGAARAREVYTKAIVELPDAHACRCSVLFANLETKLGEIERARAIFTHGAALASGEEAFFSRWSNFETKYGNAETFKTMLRVQRSV